MLSGGDARGDRAWHDAMAELCATDSRMLGSEGGSSRLFRAFTDAGAVRQVGPTRLATPLRSLELPAEGGQEAWQIFALFDCAIDGGMPAVVVDYVMQVCRDAAAVSSDATRAFLLSERLVRTWSEDLVHYLRRELHALLETVDSLTLPFLERALRVERASSSLASVFDTLVTDAEGVEGPGASLRTSADHLQRVHLASSVCSWGWEHGVDAERINGRHPSHEEWRQEFITAGRSSRKGGALIEDLLGFLGLPEGAYPFRSVSDAALQLFLRSAGSDDPESTRSTSLRAFAYFATDAGCSPQTLATFFDRFGISQAALAATRALVALDYGLDAEIDADAACSALRGGGAVDGGWTAKLVARLLELGLQGTALAVVRAMATWADHFPSEDEASMAQQVVSAPPHTTRTPHCFPSFPIPFLPSPLPLLSLSASFGLLLCSPPHAFLRPFVRSLVCVCASMSVCARLCCFSHASIHAHSILCVGALRRGFTMLRVCGRGRPRRRRWHLQRAPQRRWAHALWRTRMPCLASWPCPSRKSRRKPCALRSRDKRTRRGCGHSSCCSDAV